MPNPRFRNTKSTPLWGEQTQRAVTRARLEADIDVDVVIVGAGFTGLWTAYYLLQNSPDIRVAVIEKEFVGYGASGRNGGWCHAEFPTGIDKLAKEFGLDAAVSQLTTLFDAVDEVGRVAASEGFDCHYAKGGVISLARSPLQMRNAVDHAAHKHKLGFSEEDFIVLSEAEARTLANGTNTVGGLFTPHAATVHPGHLVNGLARAVERLGATIYEDTAALALSSGVVQTSQAVAKADVVIRATEGYTPTLPGQKRTLVPLYSLMIATEPLDSSVWDEIGMHTRPAFDDFRNFIIYGQRTADGRMAFGGRGAPYHFGSGIEDRFDIDDAVHTGIRDTLFEMFPVLATANITHRWGGPLGVPRDWRPAVLYDEQAQFGTAGGYVGDGVATTNLAGRTLADLILKRETDRSKLPWVGHEWRKWEPEPLRWIGINAGLRLARSADDTEAKTGKTSWKAELGQHLRGK